MTHPWFVELRGQFYDDSASKHVPLEFLNRELNALALAGWIMDDGARDGNQIRLNTQCFSDDDVAALAILLQSKFGIQMRRNVDKGRPPLTKCFVNDAKTNRARKKYTIETMLYKLPEQRSGVSRRQGTYE